MKTLSLLVLSLGLLSTMPVIANDSIQLNDTASSELLMADSEMSEEGAEESSDEVMPSSDSSDSSVVEEDVSSEE